MLIYPSLQKGGEVGGGAVVGVPGDIKSANKINVKLSNNINKKSRIKRNKQSHLGDNI